jgi:Tfp pilus assembly protein PilX
MTTSTTKKLRHPGSARGSALVTAVIVTLVVTVIAVGIINFASREVAGAAAGAQRQSLVSCAEAGRALLLSRFHAVGLQPTAFEAVNVPLDGPSTTSKVSLVGGHVDSPSNAVQVNQVVVLPANSTGQFGSTAIDLTNRLVGPAGSAGSGGGGAPMRVIVHCIDHGDGTATGGRQLEVEFGVRFGL